MATYRVLTISEDLSNNYSGVATAEFVQYADDGKELWDFETDHPDTLERLLDTDQSVVSYVVC